MSHDQQGDMKPERIQRQRTKGWKMPENTVNVTRPGRWGNEYKVGNPINPQDWAVAASDLTQKEIAAGVITADIAVRLHKARMEGSALMLFEIKEALRGKNIMCFCPIGEPCHGDTLLELANQPTP